MTGVRWGRAWAAVMVVVGVVGTIAYACADGGYETSWDAKQSSALLSPANDTRINLLLLLADRDGSPTADPAAMARGIVPLEFPWRVMRGRLSPPPPNAEDRWRAYYPEAPDTSLCHSNDAGASGFIDAVRAEPAISAGEKQLLVEARLALKGQCNEAAGLALPIDGAQSPRGTQFAGYLSAARHFYSTDFASALAAFGALAGADQPWVRETAIYMVARTALNRAQQSSFDEYGNLADAKDRDIAAIEAAGRAFSAYLTAYPNGRYANSARGLLRRVAWLKGDQQALGAAYSAVLGHTMAPGSNLSLNEEIDTRLLPDGSDAGVTDPILLAVVDLMRLRDDGSEQSYPNDYRGPRLDRAELERQRSLFRSNPALFDYLLAMEAFYGRKQPKEVLDLIPDAAHQQSFTYLQFSRQMLRGFALEALNDRNARAFWLSLIPGANRPYQREAVEMALAQHDGAAGTAERLFAPGSPVRHPLIRQRVLEENAGPALLRQQARTGASKQERDVALYLLLAGELHHGLYADFIHDLAMVGPRPQPETGYYGAWEVTNYDPIYGDELGPPPLVVFAAGGSDDLDPCPDIRATATSLAQNPVAIRPRLCLAEFIRRKGFDGWSQTYDAQYNRITRSRGFRGNPLERIDIYRSVLASPAATADDKAFALNRILRCFAPAGYSSCGGHEIPVSQRRAWFAQLKRDYPQSAWARDLKVYW